MATLSAVVLVLASLEPALLLPGHPVVLARHGDAVTALAFDAAGARLATASRDRSVKVWSVADGTLLQTFTGAEDQVNALALSSDGSFLAIGENALKFRIVSIARGELVVEAAHPDAVSQLAFSPDGRWLAVSGQQNSGAVVDAKSGKTRFSFRGRSARFSADGKALLVANASGSLVVLDATSGATRRTRTTGPSQSSATFAATGTVALTWSGSDARLTVWAGPTLDVSSVLTLPTLTKDEAAHVSGVSVSPDGAWAVVGLNPGSMALVNVTGRIVSQTWPVERPISPCWSKDWVAVGDGGLVKLWRLPRE